jgi:hypothetical protein
VKIRINLGDADRERLDAPDDLEVDVRAVTMRETITMQKGVEIGNGVSSYDSVSDWLAGLQKGAADEPFAYLVLVWLALRRAGRDIPLAELDASLLGTRLEFIVEPTDPGEPGKEPSDPETTS